MPPDKPPRDDEERSQSVDLYQDSQIQIDPRLRARMKDAAHEVSQGAWRERAFAPRGVMPPEEISAGLRNELKMALVSSPLGGGHALEAARQQVRTGWLPFVRQAIEQAGGDGLDGLLRALLGRPGPKVSDSLVADVLAGYAAMNEASTVDALMQEAGKVQSLIEQALAQPELKKLSFRALEKDLEGRLDLDAVLALFFSTDEELTLRLIDVHASIDNLRKQLRDSMGASPNASLWNFSRLKAERILIEAEQKRRGQRE
jgi:hypothetical protein